MLQAILDQLLFAVAIVTVVRLVLWLCATRPEQPR
jgi:hypothetical protein